MRVSLPLMRPVPGNDSPATTPTSIDSQRSHDDPIHLLKEEAKGSKVAIYGMRVKGAFDPPSEYSNNMARYMTDWYGLEVVHWPSSILTDVVIAEEKDMSKIMHENGTAGSKGGPALIIFCSQSTRHSRSLSHFSDAGGVIEFLSKPCGPYKLARALRTCLEKLTAIRSGSIPIVNDQRSSPLSRDIDVDDAPPELTEIALETLDEASQPIVMQTNNIVTASETSENAQKAVAVAGCSPLSPSEFLFPESQSGSKRHPNPSSYNKEVSTSRSFTSQNPISGSTSDSEQDAFTPRILLVDDNKINLRLLQTFMLKRDYELVDSAQDGKMAVETFQQSEEGYDIIFMGIAIPCFLSDLD